MARGLSLEKATMGGGDIATCVPAGQESLTPRTQVLQAQWE